jgi:hypothetical protein
MAKALTTLLSDLELVQQYGQAARATIEQQYALEHIIDMYRELYQKLMRQRTQKETATRRNGLIASATGIVNRSQTR